MEDSLPHINFGSVAKIIFLHFDTLILTFMCQFLSNENDLIS
jgi:hypothetical protein